MPVTIIYRRLKKYISVACLLSVMSSCALHKDAEWHPEKLPMEAEISVLESMDASLPPAIRTLIAQADNYFKDKQWDRGIAVLERALRINKRQPETWTRMAVAYLGKNEYEQSIQMAKRSNSYAKQYVELQAYNWQIISNAYLKLDKLEQAQSAAVKSQQLQGND